MNKFKPGDKVRCISNSTGASEVKPGFVGTVDKYGEDNVFWLTEFSSLPSSYRFEDDWFELIESWVPKDGERVLHTDFGIGVIATTGWTPDDPTVDLIAGTADVIFASWNGVEGYGKRKTVALNLLTKVEPEDETRTTVLAKTMSDVDICRKFGWDEGTRIVGDEGYGPSVWEITALRPTGRILAKTISYKGLQVTTDQEHLCTLSCRDWTEVSKPVPENTLLMKLREREHQQRDDPNRCFFQAIDALQIFGEHFESKCEELNNNFYDRHNGYINDDEYERRQRVILFGDE